jgi:hypothetical protein
MHDEEYKVGRLTGRRRRSVHRIKSNFVEAIADAHHSSGWR